MALAQFDSVPSQQSVDLVHLMPVTNLKLASLSRDCCVESILGKRNGRFLYSLAFDGSCAVWEGRVQVPAGDTTQEIQEAWVKHCARSGHTDVSPLYFVSDPDDKYACTCKIGDIIELGQKSNNGPLWYKRALRVTVEEVDYDGYVYVRRDDPRTVEAIKDAREKQAHALDNKRDEPTAIPSTESVEAGPADMKTFQFPSYPQAGRGIEVDAEDVHGWDLKSHRVAIIAARREGTTRNVRFRCSLPGGRTHWFQGCLTGDLRLGRFKEIDES